MSIRLWNPVSDIFLLNRPEDSNITVKCYVSISPFTGRVLIFISFKEKIK